MTWVSTPILSFTNNTNNYSQVTCQNLSTGNAASCDFIAYSGTDINDNQGYMDMGINNHLFNQSTYNVALADEGYLFMSAPNAGTGNMILATDSTGTQNSIKFCTNGLTSNSSCRMYVFGTGRISIGNPTDNGIDALQVTGSISATGIISPKYPSGINGNISGNSPSPGSMSEYPTPSGSAVSLTSTVSANIASITLSAGDWDITGTGGISAATTTQVTSIQIGFSTTSAIFGSYGTYWSWAQTSSLTNLSMNNVIPTYRSISSLPVTIYCVGQATFLISTTSANCNITARRR